MLANIGEDGRKMNFSQAKLSKEPIADLDEMKEKEGRNKTF